MYFSLAAFAEYQSIYHWHCFCWLPCNFFIGFYFIFLLFDYGCRLPHFLLFQFKWLRRMCSGLCNPRQTCVCSWHLVKYIRIFEETAFSLFLDTYNGDIPVQHQNTAKQQVTKAEVPLPSILVGNVNPIERSSMAIRSIFYTIVFTEGPHATCLVTERS